MERAKGGRWLGPRPGRSPALWGLPGQRSAAGALAGRPPKEPFPPPFLFGPHPMPDSRNFGEHQGPPQHPASPTLYGERARERELGQRDSESFEQAHRHSHTTLNSPPSSLLPPSSPLTRRSQHPIVSIVRQPSRPALSSPATILYVLKGCLRIQPAAFSPHCSTVS